MQVNRTVLVAVAICLAIAVLVFIVMLMGAHNINPAGIPFDGGY